MGTEGRGTAAAVAASTTANAAGAGVDVASGVAGDAAGCETGTPLFLYGTLMNDKVNDDVCRWWPLVGGEGLSCCR